MKIAVNLHLYWKGKIGGIENYVRQVAAGIAANQAARNQEWTVFAQQPEIEHVQDICPGAKVIGVSPESTTKTIEEELRRGPYDLFFCPLLVLDPLRPGIPSAVTIPDLQHEYYPEFFDSHTLQWRRRMFRPSVHNADVVFTISEFSKKTIVEKFGVDPEKIVVVDLAADREFQIPASSESRNAFHELGLFDEYIYYPANYWPHKNHSALLRAMQLLVRGGYPKLGLVLTGAAQGVERVQGEIAALGLENNVRILAYQERAVIAEIYRHARALAFVSRFEGFGIPILEAFHTGTPVVSSGTCSLPEVAGDAALLIDEASPESIAGGLRRILSDDALRMDLIEKGTRRARNYSWSRAVDLTLEWFERIAQSVRPVQVQVQEYPLVSIVTPSYNTGRFLEETIESVLSQDYPHIEYIVMDGGSSDDTIQILRKYEDKLRYRSEKDRGQADAINRGFAFSTGQVFAYLNADDTYLPGAVGTAVSHLRANDSVGVIYGEAYHVREDGSTVNRYPTYPFEYEYLNRNCFICQPAAFMRRDAFATVGGMNADLHWAMDYDLWIRIAKVYPFLKVDEYLATSRMHAANKTLGSRQRVYREILSIAKTQYGYAPFDWIFGYACYLADRKDQFFEATRPSLVKYSLSLLLGCYYNPAQMRRFAGEWAAHLGIGREFTGRWRDGWISKRYLSEVAVPRDCEQISFSGKHLAPLRGGITLSIRLNGQPLDKKHLLEPGPFAIKTTCPADSRGKNIVMEIESNRTFRPSSGGDYRKLSCIIESVSFE